MIQRLILSIFLIFTLFAMTACFDSNPDEQSVPWSRPADWERGAPGLGGY